MSEYLHLVFMLLSIMEKRHESGIFAIYFYSVQLAEHVIQSNRLNSFLKFRFVNEQILRFDWQDEQILKVFL